MNKHKPKKISKFTHVKLGSNKEEHSFEDENQNKEPYQDQESLNSDDGKQETNSQKKSTDFGFLNGFSLSGKKNNSKAFDKDDEDLFFDESDRQNESEDDFNQSRRKYLPFSANNKEGQVNSLGLVFNQDFSENAGLQRVFKKSMIFLSLNLLSFLLLAVFGIIFFQVNILLSLFVFVLYSAITNIFFIILADKNYVWLSLAGQALTILLLHSFIGQAFNIITLIFIILISILTYFAYSELEKIQLGSRVFSISLVTTESTRVLTNVATLVVCIGVFNQIVNLTPAEFIRETVFRNDFVRENFVFDDGLFPINLNKVFLKSYANMDSEDPYTFYRFLLDNYKDSRVVTEEEAASLSERELLELKRERAEEWRQEAYGNLPYTIDTKLTPEVFEDVAEEYYINPVENFSNNEKRDSELNWEQYLLVDREYIIPAGITLAVYFVLFAARFVLNYIVFIFTWIIWRVLIYFGFAKIDVESVEAEVVSI